MSTAPPVDYDDIQGLVRFGYKHHTQASLPAAARDGPRRGARWLATAPVSSARDGRAAAGDRAAGRAQRRRPARARRAPTTIVEGFAAEFIAGMSSDASRARRLGDVGANDPAAGNGAAGGARAARAGDALRHAGRARRLRRARSRRSATRASSSWRCLTTTDMDGVEPFGFADGISQPSLDWQRERPARDEERADYTQPVAASANSCSAIRTNTAATPTGRCSTRARRRGAPAARRGCARPRRPRPQRQLPRAAPAAAGRARLLAFIDAQAGGDAGAREQLAEAMVGRTLDGEPLDRRRPTKRSKATAIPAT